MGSECLSLVMPVLAQGSKAVDELLQEVLKEQNKRLLSRGFYAPTSDLPVCVIQCLTEIVNFQGWRMPAVFAHWHNGISVFPTFPEELQCLSDT